MRFAKYGLATLALAALGMMGSVYLAPHRALAVALDLERARAGLERHERQMPDGTRNPLLVRRKEDLRALVPIVMEKPPFLPRPLIDATARARIENADLEERILQQIATDSIEGRAAGLATPTLIVWGDQDRALHVGSAAILHALMPRSQVIIMTGIGHLPMLERPKRSADDYTKFRARR